MDHAKREELIVYLQTGQSIHSTRNIRSKAQHYKLNDDGKLLNREGKLVLTQDEFSDIVKVHHLQHEHQKRDLLYASMKELYVWPGGREAVTNFIKLCDTCAWDKRIRITHSQFAKFTVLSESTARRLCSNVGLSFTSYMRGTSRKCKLARLIPDHIHRVMADGNCFYRCVAENLCGDQSQHHVIRKLTKVWVTRHRKIIKEFLGDRADVDRHIRNASFSVQDSPATEVEFLAVAIGFQTDIFIHDFPDADSSRSGWYCYPASCTHDRIFAAAGIYLNRRLEHVDLVATTRKD